jgi:hypothetical protein
MLHLIWHKDNTTTNEDGRELKGIRSRLLECYRALYFEPRPDLEPKKQVNEIAKNLIMLASTRNSQDCALIRFPQAHPERYTRRAHKFRGDAPYDDGGKTYSPRRHQQALASLQCDPLNPRLSLSKT